MVTFLDSEIVKNIILPFLLVFTLIFAVLEKSKLLGQDKRQINAIVGFVIALILVTFSEKVGWIQQFVVFLSVALVILFVFMLLYGFAAGTTDGDPFKGLEKFKMFLLGLIFIAVVIAVLVITNTWDNVKTFFTSSNAGINTIVILVIVGAVAAVLWGGKAPEKKSG